MTAGAISARIKIPKATVARILKRHGLERLKYLEPPEPVRRYEKTYPGELVHVDIEKLLGPVKGVGHRIAGHHSGMNRNRGIGWDFVHVCVDDYSRVAHVEVLEDEKSFTAAAFRRRAAAWFAERGVKIRRRRAALPAWLRRYYNDRRPHCGIGGAPPITRLPEAAA